MFSGQEWIESKAFLLHYTLSLELTTDYYLKIQHFIIYWRILFSQNIKNARNQLYEFQIASKLTKILGVLQF